MQDVISSISFEEFYKAMDLIRYPFRERTAEKEDAPKLFVKPLDYSRLNDDLSNS